ncbi:MAG: hypothetical protein HOW97_32960 [Catenulispora sp.]|nr:hypothetical protein [Catenulispora sp.]
MVIIAVVAIVCCVIGGNIGSGKGRFDAGAFLGLLLGPVGLLVLLLLPPTIEAAAIRAEAIEAERRKLRGEPDPAPEASAGPPTA